MLQRRHSSDVCDLVSTLCKYDLRRDDLFVLSWARVTSENGKCLFRAANVCWRCTQYFDIASCDHVSRCMHMALVYFFAYAGRVCCM